MLIFNYVQSFHPNPGKRFIGRKETLFLPDNDLGRSFASMIGKAFQRKILYEVKTSTTQRIELVVGNYTNTINKRYWLKKYFHTLFV